MWQTRGAAECMMRIKTLIRNHALNTMCEQKGSAGIGRWENLVFPSCVLVDLPGKHVERLAILLHARMQRICHP